MFFKSVKFDLHSCAQKLSTLSWSLSSHNLRFSTQNTSFHRKENQQKWQAFE